MSGLNRFFGIFFAYVALSGAVSAQTIDRVKFVQAPMVVVWDGEAEPQVGAVVTVSSPANISVPTNVRTGILEPVGASFASVEGASQKSFRVASNTAFAIRVQAFVKPGAADALFRLRIGKIGANAQAPGALELSDGPMLSELATPRLIYVSDRRTALQAGSANSQSVEFIADWTASGAATDVAITVLVP